MQQILMGLALGVGLAFGVASQAADSDESSAGRKTLIVVCRNVPAEEIAGVLGRGFEGRPIDVVAVPISNSLLISAESDVLEKLTSVMQVLDRAPRTVRLDIVLAHVQASEPLETGVSVDELPVILDRWQAAGTLLGLDRATFATLENQRAQVEVGQQVSVVSGRVFMGGRPSSSPRGIPNYEKDQVGTIVSVTSRVSGDDAVALDLAVEKSALAPNPSPDSDSAPPPEKTIISFQSTNRIPFGATYVVGSKGDSKESWVLILRADVVTTDR